MQHSGRLHEQLANGLNRRFILNGGVGIFPKARLMHGFSFSRLTAWGRDGRYAGDGRGENGSGDTVSILNMGLVVGLGCWF